jgi:DNA repair protein RadC
MKKISDLPEMDKPREKLIRNGASSLSDVELLAVLIGKGYSKKDVLQVALDVKTRYGDKLDKIEYDELRNIKGIGEVKACQILSSFELARRYFGKKDVKITFPEDVLPFVRDFRDKKQEHFICISLNGANEIIKHRVITIGQMNFNHVHPRDIFSDILMDHAASVILVHNHPNGNAEPSKDDVELTKKLIQAGELLGIKIHDHIIVSKNGYTSMKEQGLI